MADRTLFNEDLVLSSLTISNSTSSNAAGYVPSSTTVTPAVITTTEVAFIGNGSTATPYLNTNAGNGLVLSTPSGTGLTFSTPSGGGSIVAGAGFLVASEEFKAPSFLISGNGSTVNPSISTNSNNSLVLAVQSGTGVSIVSGLGGANLTPQSGYLAISETVDCPTFQVSGGGATTKPTLSANSANNLVVSFPNGSGITISSPQGNGTLTVNSSNQLLWNGVVIS